MPLFQAQRGIRRTAPESQNTFVELQNCFRIAYWLEIFVLGVEFPALLANRQKSEGRVLDFLYRFEG